MEKESKSVGLKKEESCKNQVRWRVGVGEIAGRIITDVSISNAGGIRAHSNFIGSRR